MTQFQIRKDNFSTQRLVESSTNETALNTGEVRVNIIRFALTANNITYAAMGDFLGYWQFFPAQGDDSDGWGVIPVWGFAEVCESTLDELPVGDRLYGYFPPADQLVMKPVNISSQRFVDGAEHRAKLPPGYNNYRRINPEAAQDLQADNEQMLLSPLFITSYCLWDSLQDKDWYGAQQVIVVSASSKTSVGLAYALHGDKAAPKSVGVTSTKNLAQVNSLGLYDSVVTYDSLDQVDANLPTVIVDMSGNSEVLRTLSSHLGNNMKFCINVGLTHWEERTENNGLDEGRSEFFFAPGHIQKRIKEWGIKEFEQKTSSFITETALKSRTWLKLKTVSGLNSVPEVYADVCDGRVAADEGIIVEL